MSMIELSKKELLVVSGGAGLEGENGEPNGQNGDGQNGGADGQNGNNDGQNGDSDGGTAPVVLLSAQSARSTARSRRR